MTETDWLAGSKGGWVHADETVCGEYLAPLLSVPPGGYWCATHQMFVHHPESPCPLCKGHCTNGAQCAISQFVGKPIDWMLPRPEQEYKATLITDLLSEPAPSVSGTEEG